MTDVLKHVTTFVEAVALIMALVLMISITRRSSRTSVKNSILIGGVFSAGVIMTMIDPIDLGSAGIFDMRGLLIGTATALWGPVAGVITMTTGMAMRISIGGNGLIPGIASIFLALVGGLLWRMFIRPKDLPNLGKSVILGIMITAQSVAILLTPQELWGQLFWQLVPYTLATNILGAALINHLISGELSFLSQATASRIEANTDHLTGLLNRRGLEMIYPDLQKDRGTTSGRALICFDIDCFKSINDTHGHGVGDEVLRSVTTKVSNSIRPEDVFARLGGDEFVILLNNIDRQEAEKIAHRCRAIVAEDPYFYGDISVPVSISLGGVWLFAPADIENVLDDADGALYAAKKAGRNRVVFKYGLARSGTPHIAVPA